MTPSKLCTFIDKNQSIKNDLSILEYVRFLDKECETVFGKSSMTYDTIQITDSIHNIGDLINIADNYPYHDNIRYNIDLELIQQIAAPLRKLHSMIGMRQIKKELLLQLLYYIQGLHIYGNGDFMHTVIYGPPGTGKTEVAKIIGEIFTKIGVLKKGTFRKVTRADLIAGFLGQTAAKTRQVVEESLGGVLFIDEAYSLGDPERRDSFAKECLDTLCELLSEHKSNLMVIIAGYEEELKQCFFEYNAGLESRFPWRYDTGNYNADELCDIFMKQVCDSGWSIADDVTATRDIFSSHMSIFKHYGRDMEVLFTRTKIAHSLRIFGQDESCRSILTVDDIEAGLDNFVNSRITRADTTSTNMMYL